MTACFRVCFVGALSLGSNELRCKLQREDGSYDGMLERL